jgi:RNA polymerase sigma-70 factor, ECF subfamily
VDARARELETLYRERYVAFRNTFTTIMGSREAARDVVQEAFARALRERRKFCGDASLETWVWRIAFRVALSDTREQHVEWQEELDPIVPEATRDPALAQAVQALAPRQRLIVFLRYFADLSYTEIAAVCEVAEGTVAATLYQAHRVLAAQLQEEACR